MIEKISENKAEKTWWKSIIEKVPESEIAASAQNMMKVYMMNGQRGFI